MTTIEQISDDFAFLDDWEDRYRYVIELGRTLAPLADADRTAENKVRGCASQVWLKTSILPGKDGPRLKFIGDSDAHIVRGLVAIAIALFDGKTPAEILKINAQAVFDRLGLSQHLSAQRSNGLRSLVERIKADAEASLVAA
jgi:cysteine desulfuration protein SufE